MNMTEKIQPKRDTELSISESSLGHLKCRFLCQIEFICFQNPVQEKYEQCHCCRQSKKLVTLCPTQDSTLALAKKTTKNIS